MTSVLVYMQYRAVVQFEPDAGLFRGRILNAPGAPPFEGRRRSEVLAAFSALADSWGRVSPAENDAAALRPTG